METVAIFFLANLYLKQGIICMGLLELHGAKKKRELQNEKFFSTAGYSAT